MTADQLEDALRKIGEERYHNHHCFHKRLHAGEMTKPQVQAWALNRFYYQ
ncbi:MAG: pyrroloquinoline quinone biosynthesis protein C, partial [Alphaproteobacteria bacterium]|nr:pyrroloquinoline quinone biosynthesis protein C [Alphaproteobacteria bacterium]